MTSHITTEGFVFKKEDVLESDRVFSVFTKDFGRVEILGKSIRKITSKLKSGIEVFSLSEIEFIQGKNRKTLTDAAFIERFKNISENPEKLWVAITISRILDTFIRGEEKDDNIFQLLEDVFAKLNDSAAYFLIYVYFFWNFISVLGYASELTHCASCHKKLNPYELYFSNKEGGIICKSCYNSTREGIKVTSDVVKFLRLLCTKEWDTLVRLRIGGNTQKSLREISSSYYKYLLATHSSEQLHGF